MSGDATALAKAHSDAFARAFAAGDTKAILAMYTDDATVVWPGQGDEAHGRAAIGKLVETLIKSSPNSTLTLKSQNAVALGARYIVIVGHWEHTVTAPDGMSQMFEIRTSEVLREDGNVWRYLIDHASIGLPPPPSR